jgi:flagellar biogenesis protein FliO
MKSGIFNLILGQTVVPPAQISIAEMIMRMVLFLVLLALGGYFFVLLSRRGCFCFRKSASNKRSGDEIKVVSIRILSGKKYLAVIEHFGRRFLLALTGDRVDKLSEWEVCKGETGNDQENLGK